MDALLRDFRLAIRALVRVPGFTAIAVVTLGIGIGTTALMFTTVNAAFLTPLPFADSSRLAHVWQVSPRSSQIAIAGLVWQDLAAEMKSFSSLGAVLGAGPVNVSNGRDAERVQAGQISRNLFATLGVLPSVGRTFSEDEATEHGPVAVLISDALWDRLFGRAADVLSRTISIEGVGVPIVGVMPPGFAYPAGTDIWAAFERNGLYGTRTSHNFEVIGRLAPGVSLEQAQAEIATVTGRLHAAHADMAREGYQVRVADLRADLLDSSSSAVLLLFGAVGFVLLIACANVVNLLLARSISRESQTTLRIALGASRGDITRLFVIESVTLAVLGGAVGAVLTIWAGDLATGLLPASLLPPGALRADARVFAVILGLMAGVGVVCGLVPSRHASRQSLGTTIAAGTRSVTSEPGAMRLLIGVEAALAVMLLAGAGLLVRSLINLQQVDLGFRRDGAVVAGFSLGAAPGSRYDSAAGRAQFFDALLERVAAMPGIRSAGVASSFPFTFTPNALLEEEGVPPAEWGRAPSTSYQVVGGDYFTAMAVPLVAGRGFTASDRDGAPDVAIVNQATVRTLWNGGDALGRRVRMRSIDGRTGYATIVGVVGDIRQRGIDTAAVPEVYFPYAQRPNRTFSMTLVVETTLDAAAIGGQLRALIREIDPAVAIRPQPLAARVGAQLAAPRFRTGLLAGFAGVAVALAAFGIFGVVSYSVARRTRELGIRLALGAAGSDVRRLVLRRALTPVVIGLFVGSTAALLGSRLLAGLTFGVTNTDPVTFATSLALLVAVAFLGAWIPAQRATRVNPLAALRAE